MFEDKGSALIEAIKSGRAILLLGAGFSSEIENRPGHYIPRAGELTESLKSHFSIPTNAGLDETFNALKELNPQTVSSFLEQELCVKDFNSIPKVYHVLTRLPWRRIYTLNFDNVLSLLAEKLNPELKIKFFGKGNASLIRDDEKIIYLNGKLPIKSFDDITITPGDYSNRQDEFIECFAREFLQLPVVILGCQLREPHFDRAVGKYLGQHNPRRTEAGYFINKFSDPVVDRNWYRDHNLETINAGISDFLNWLNVKFPDQQTLKLEEKYHHRKNQMMIIDDIETLNEVSKDTSIMENPLDGKFIGKEKRTSWEEISKSIIKIHDFFDFGDENSFYVISGKQGSGKSTFLLHNISSFLSHYDRTVIFVHPSQLNRGLPTQLADWIGVDYEEEEPDLSEVLIVIDALKREKEPIETAGERLGLIKEISDSTGAKFLLSIRDNEFDAILTEMDESFRYKYQEKRLKEYSRDALHAIIDSYSNYYQIEQKESFENVKAIITEKSRQSPAYIRTLFNYFIQKQLPFNESEMAKIPAGSSNLTYYRIGLFYRANTSTTKTENNWISFLIRYLKKHPQGLTRQSIYLIARRFSDFETESIIDDFIDTILSSQTLQHSSKYEKYYLDSHTLADLDAGIEETEPLEINNRTIKSEIVRYHERNYHEDYEKLKRFYVDALNDGISSLSGLAFAVDYLDLKFTEEYNAESFTEAFNILTTTGAKYTASNAELRKELNYQAFNDTLFFHWRSVIRKEEIIYRSRLQQRNQNVYKAYKVLLDKTSGAGRSKSFAKLDFAVFLRKKMIPADSENFKKHNEEIKEVYEDLLYTSDSQQVLQNVFVDYSRYLMEYDLENELIEKLLNRSLDEFPENASAFSVYGNYLLTLAKKTPDTRLDEQHKLLERGRQKYIEGFAVFKPNTVNSVTERIKRDETVYRNAYASFLSEYRFFTTGTEEEYDRILEDIHEQYNLLEVYNGLHKQSLNKYALFLMKDGFRLKDFRGDSVKPLLKAEKLLQSRRKLTLKKFGNGEPETLNNLAVLYLRYFKRRGLDTPANRSEAQNYLKETIASNHPKRAPSARLELSSLYLIDAIESTTAESRKQKTKEAFDLLSEVLKMHIDKGLDFHWDFTIRAYVLLSALSQICIKFNIEAIAAETSESYLNQAISLAAINTSYEESLSKALSYLLQDFADYDPELMLSYLIKVKDKIMNPERYADNCFTAFFKGKGRMSNEEENKERLLDLAEKWYQNYPSMKSLQNFAHYALANKKPGLLIKEKRYADALNLFFNYLSRSNQSVDYNILSTLNYYSKALRLTDLKKEGEKLASTLQMASMFFPEFQLRFLQSSYNEERIELLISKGVITDRLVGNVLIYVLNGGVFSNELRGTIVNVFFPEGKYTRLSKGLPNKGHMLAIELGVSIQEGLKGTPYEQVINLCRKRLLLKRYFEDGYTDKQASKEALLFTLLHYHRAGSHDEVEVLVNAIEFLILTAGIFDRLEKRVWLLIKTKVLRNQSSQQVQSGTSTHNVLA